MFYRETSTLNNETYTHIFTLFMTRAFLSVMTLNMSGHPTALQLTVVEGTIEAQLVVQRSTRCEDHKLMRLDMINIYLFRQEIR